MDYQLIVTICVIVGAMILFVTETLRIDLVAILAMVAWVILGVLEPEESFQGFANSATLTVAAMFILSDTLIRTGIVQLIAPLVVKLFSKSYAAAIFGMGLGTGLVSAFINNTPVVATFIPIVNDAATKVKMAPTKFLIPLSYAAIFGGACTLIGTSTNLLVAGIASNYGENGITMFVMAPLGLIFMIVGMLYLIFIGRRFLPDEIGKPLQDESEIKSYLTEIEITTLPEEDNGLTLKQLFEDKDIEVDVYQLKRGKETINKPQPDTPLQTGDVLVVLGAIDKVKQVIADSHLDIVGSIKDKNFPEEETKLVEVIIMPGTRLVGKKLENVNFLWKYRANVLAIRQRGKRKFTHLDSIKLNVGDLLLLQTNERGLQLIQEEENRASAPFMSVSQSALKVPQKRDLLIVGGTLLIAILLATFNVIPIVASAWAAVVFLAVIRIISMPDIYTAIDWKVIFLLVGSLSFGKAMEESGLSNIIADLIRNILDTSMGPVLIIAVIYLITTLLTEVMSNNAAVALITPIAIALSRAMEVNSLPLLIAVMMAGSASFLTPIGYQTNTMVYSAGNYSFKDFFKVGGPLNLLFWIIASLLIPVLYPL